MVWSQTLDVTRFRFINQTLSTPLFDAGTASLASDWLAKWSDGETDLSAQPLETGTVPSWLTEQFESVANLGLHPVLDRGRILRTVEIVACGNPR